MKNDAFLTKVNDLKSQHGIDLTNTRTGDKVARRITILCTNVFLLARDDEEQNRYRGEARHFERCLYETVKKEHFHCDPIPQELRLEDLPKGSKSGIDPLRLVSEPFHYPILRQHPLVPAVIDILKGGADGTDDEASGIAETGNPGKIPWSNESDACSVAEKAQHAIFEDR